MTEWHALTAFRHNCRGPTVGVAHEQKGAATKKCPNADWGKPIAYTQLSQTLDVLRGLIERGGHDDHTIVDTLISAGRRPFGSKYCHPSKIACRSCFFQRADIDERRLSGASTSRTSPDQTVELSHDRHNHT